MPVTNGPTPNPNDNANAARRAPVSSAAPLDNSFTQAVPAAKTAPLANPATKRPAKSNATEWSPIISSTVATSDIATAGRTMRLRPHRSAAGPPSSRATISASA